MEEAAAAGPGWGWAALVLLFAVSLLTVSAWLLQLGRSLWRGGGGGGRAAEALRSQAAPAPAGLWAAVLRLGSGRGGAGSCPAAGARGLLASLFAFRAFRENWQRAWLRALNDQARQHGSSVQITFEESPRQLPAVTINHVTCTDQSDHRMVLHCLLSTDTLQFPVLVAQQSPAAVSMDTYCVSLAVQQAQLEIRLEEVEGEGLLVSWAFKDRPDLKLSIPPRLQPHCENDGKADLSIVKHLIEDAIISTQPAMMVNLKAGITNANTVRGERGGLGGPHSFPLLAPFTGLGSALPPPASFEPGAASGKGGQPPSCFLVRIPLCSSGQRLHLDWPAESPKVAAVLALPTGHLRGFVGGGRFPPASYLVPPGSAPQETSSSQRPLGSLSSSAPIPRPKLLLQHLRALHLGPQESQGKGLLCCEVELDSPRQQKRTDPVPASPGTGAEWPGKLLL
uniref:C2CD2 like n=1 Tax=Pseudonaja textilis TaxID=8673 RepID=A0A670Y3V4_PSETE